MAAIVFPSSPSVNQTFTASGKQWQWDGTAWQLLNIASSPHADTHASGGTDRITISQTQVIDLNSDISALNAVIAAKASLASTSTKGSSPGRLSYSRSS